jgi:hypothetical protein
MRAAVVAAKAGMMATLALIATTTTHGTIDAVEIQRVDSEDTYAKRLKVREEARSCQLRLVIWLLVRSDQIFFWKILLQKSHSKF